MRRKNRFKTDDLTSGRRLADTCVSVSVSRARTRPSPWRRHISQRERARAKRPTQQEIMSFFRWQKLMPKSQVNHARLLFRTQGKYGAVKLYMVRTEQDILMQAPLYSFISFFMSCATGLNASQPSPRAAEARMYVPQLSLPICPAAPLPSHLAKFCAFSPNFRSTFS